MKHTHTYTTENGFVRRPSKFERFGNALLLATFVIGGLGFISIVARLLYQIGVPIWCLLLGGCLLASLSLIAYGIITSKPSALDTRSEEERIMAEEARKQRQEQYKAERERHMAQLGHDNEIETNL